MSVQHENPTNTGVPVAYASYNFVPLPANNIVVEAADVYSKSPSATGPDNENAAKEGENEVKATSELPPHDCYDVNRHTGYFDVTLTTKSPLYVRCALRRSAQPSDSAEAKFFFKRAENVPVIPGSSLRGMLRSVVEIAGYGKFNRVTDRRLFYRDVRNRQLYTGNFVEEASPIKAGFRWQDGKPVTHNQGPVYSAKTKVGFLIATGRKHAIEEGIVARIHIPDVQALLGAPLYEQSKGRDLRPFWKVTAVGVTEPLQYRDIWVDLDPSEQNYFFPLQPGKYPTSPPRHKNLYLKMRMARNPSLTSVPGKVKGTLVLTGPMQHQHLAFVFFRKADIPPALHTACNVSGLGSVAIPDASDTDDPNEQLWERFHEDQLTQWQEGAFPAGRRGSCPKEKGHLCVGDPVFYLAENRGGALHLVFFGRASLFRLPYQTRPIDLVPQPLRDDRVIDYADALFGYVRDKQTEPNAKAGNPARAFAGRVCVTEARLADNQTNIWLMSNSPTPRTITPKILSSPKPTSYQHYLTQNAGSYPIGPGRQLFHYDSNLEGQIKTSLRGHKIYWHQGWQKDHLKTEQDWYNEIREMETIADGDTQHTKLNPVKPEVSFTFRVYFENLNARELGALCWAINPAPETGKVYCHKLGMGKPLGMGSVKLSATLFLTDRIARYTSLFTGDNWNIGAKMTITEAQALKAFEEHVLEQITPEQTCSHLSDMKRIAMFLRMIEFTNNWNFAWNMPLEDKDNALDTAVFKLRPILPDPSYSGPLSGNVLESQPRHALNTSTDSSAQTNHRLAETTPSVPATIGVSRTGFNIGDELTVRVVNNPAKGKVIVEINREGKTFQVQDVRVGSNVQKNQEIVITVTKVNDGKIAKGGATEKGISK